VQVRPTQQAGGQLILGAVPVLNKEQSACRLRGNFLGIGLAGRWLIDISPLPVALTRKLIAGPSNGGPCTYNPQLRPLSSTHTV
jgi:hypothetical protein